MTEGDAISRIESLYDEGDECLNAGDCGRALACYEWALALIPEPKREDPRSARIYSAIGDAHFDLSDYESALAAFSEAFHCPGGIETPYVYLRRGQALFELGEFDSAADQLARAYMLGAEDIFEGEDPKYFEFLSTRIIID